MRTSFDLSRLTARRRSKRLAGRSALTALTLGFLLLAFAAPAQAAPATIVDNTSGTATNNGTVGSGEYIGYTTGINSAFGNVIGSNSQLHIDADSAGNLNLGLVTGGGTLGGGSGTDAVVIYIDAVSGGFTSTSSFTDTGDRCRKVISGFDGANRATLNFASGFAADYAICIDNSFAGVFQLVSGGSHGFVVNANRTTATANHFEINLAMTNIGLAAGGTFKYVATYLSDTAFRSDEFHGVAQSTIPSGNPGRTTVSLAGGDYNVFTSYAPVVASAGGSSTGYTTLKGAFDAINLGTHTGAISVKINANTTETASAVLNASGAGSASYTSVAIGPGNAGVSVSGNVIGALVDLNGADNVTIDGRVGGAGSSKDLTFENTNTSNPTLRFINDATSNTIRYTVLKGGSTSDCSSTASGGVVFFGTTTGASGNDSNTLDNNDIRDGSAGTPRHAICSYGTGSGKQNSSITLSNNNIYNFWNASATSSGLFLPSGGNNDLWTISGNSFYQTATRTATAGTTHYAMNILQGSPGSFTISGNFIGGSAPSAGGSAWTLTHSTVSVLFVGIRLSSGTSPVTSIQGNTIANMSFTTNSSANTIPGVWCGMSISGGAADIGTITGNTIGSGTATGSINVTTGGSGSMTYGICSDSAGAKNIQNNVIGGITANGSSTNASASVTGIAMGGSGAVTISNNTIGSTSTANSLNAATASTSGTGQSVAGLNISSTTSGAVTISNNTIANLNNNYVGTGTAGQTHGILVTGSTGAVGITGNTVRDVTTASGVTGTGSGAALLGIAARANGAASQTVSQNLIHSLSATAGSGTVGSVGLFYNGPFAGINIVARNLVHSLKVATSSTAHLAPAISGIYFAGGTGLTVHNNLVRVGIDAGGASITTGYWIDGINFTNGTANFYYNTAYVGGTNVASSANTAAFNSGVTTNTRIYRNNIWINARSNASGAAVNAAAIIAGTLPNPAGLTSDYNLYYAPGIGGTLVRSSTGGTNYATLAAWNSASGQDANSVSGDPLLGNPTGTASTVDLHVTAGSNYDALSAASNAGTPVSGVTVDYDNGSRDASYPDIGADEFTVTRAPSSAGTFPTGNYDNMTAPAAGASLGGSARVFGTLTLNGALTLGTNTLTLMPNATIAGGPFSASNMVVADGGGSLCKRFTAAGSFIYPIGDNTGTAEYSPATLNFTSGTFAGAQACVRVVDAAHPNGDQTNYPTYITRYWTVTQTGISGFNCTATFNYVEADEVIGSGQSTAALFHWSYNGSTWTQLNQADAANNILSSSVTSFSDHTARSGSPLAVDLAAMAAMPQLDHVLLTWETVSEQDNTGFDVYRTGSVTDRPEPGHLLAFVPSLNPGGVGGASYTYLDADVAAGQTYWYWLEDVDLSGGRTLHGPVSVTYAGPTAVELTGLSAGSRSVFPLPLWTVLAALGLALAAVLGLRPRQIPQDSMNR